MTVGLRVDIVVPTLGRPSLRTLLDALGPGDGRVFVVDDRPDRSTPLDVPSWVTVLPGRGAGPACARNVGWRSSASEWIAFLDDDVVPPPGWRELLHDDVAALPDRVAGSQGQIDVPLPVHRRPTDWERNTAGLADARWATADMAYRRAALVEADGFDERFPRAFREDADLALRLRRAGWDLVRGQRRVLHPPRPVDRWVSVRMQRGNADDVLMRVLHGRRWRREAQAPPGRLRRHLAVTTALGLALAAATRRPRLGAAALVGWAAGTAELAWARIAPGPRTRREIATMLATSVALPPAATYHWARGWATARRRLRGPRTSGPPAAVLLDRDGTLVVDVPYNGDPDRVVAMPAAERALARLRAAGVPTAVVSNQSGIGRRLLTPEQVAAVNRRIEDLLGPVGPWFVCPHAPDDGCECRKPRPGLVLEAARHLGVPPERVVLIGDIGADMAAAQAAGARAVLVPTQVTRPEEVAAAPEVAADLDAAVSLVLGGHP